MALPTGYPKEPIELGPPPTNITSVKYMYPFCNMSISLKLL